MENKTLNNGSGQSADAAGSSPAGNEVTFVPTRPDDDGMVSTVDMVAVAAAKPESSDKEKADATKAADEAAKPAAVKAEGDDADAGEFHKNPAWQRIMKERDAERTRADKAEGALSVIHKPAVDGAAGGDLPGGEKTATQTLDEMSTEDLADLMEDNPKEYNRLTRQAAKEDMQADQVKAAQQHSVKSYEQAAINVYDKYGKANPDFVEMWDNGKIREFMQNNPGHNVISAHMTMTGDTRSKAAIDEAVAKAIKETEERVTNNFKAKRHATVLTGGPSGGAPQNHSDVAVELQTPKSFGGDTAVLANRLKEMRKAAA